MFHAIVLTSSKCHAGLIGHLPLIRSSRLRRNRRWIALYGSTLSTPGERGQYSSVLVTMGAYERSRTENLDIIIQQITKERKHPNNDSRRTSSELVSLSVTKTYTFISIQSRQRAYEDTTRLKVCLSAHDLGRVDRFHLVHPT
jgi:hypothetical protein